MTSSSPHRPQKRRGVWPGARTALAVLAAGAVLAACGGEDAPPPPPPDHFGYAVGSELRTSNAGSTVGVSDHADYVVARVYPAAFVAGPKGQMIPNTDLVAAQAVPGRQKKILYRIHEQARYSDGVPVTCDDFHLAVVAGQRQDIFPSHIPLAEQVDQVDCVPGSKDFSVLFKEGLGDRWRQLFSAGTVLPSHTIQQAAAITPEAWSAALAGMDDEALQAIATQWDEGFRLSEFRPEMQVSYGPYRIDSVREDGGVVLVRNESWAGDPAEVAEIVVWPKSTDLAAKNATGSVEIADLIGVPTVDWVDRNDPTNHFDVSFGAGELIEELVLSNDGVLASPEARQAFAACIDQPAIAAVSSSMAGVETPPLATRLLPYGDPLNDQTRDIAEAHLGIDVERASALAGQQIHIGYMGPDPRKAAMVEAMRASCAQAGIDIVDAHDVGGSVSQLHRQVPTPWGGVNVLPGALDAVLVGMDPLLQYPGADVDPTDVEGVRAAEVTLWEEVPTVPLCAQPRTFVIDRQVGNVVVNTASAGIGWNMDRWQENPQ
ncbi:ABC transporter substrate-binding protein [Corynebacterium sp. 13CS0277]|uniref:ABC transporter substrate-binding protein n=1 Tax=Corynebacterium sp. 13CS0277 TaxID=2071994 RepID=UPI001E37E109|nr:ABC transporter substrate-binding protein [Corynebacterium sp. 13CS0277]